MVESKGWSWADVKNPIWLEPCEESYFYAHKWMKAFKEKHGDELDEAGAPRKPSVLDLGCGLGRHSILFAKEGFKVTSIDISRDGVNFLRKWEHEENLIITSTVGDILHLPFADDAFDFIFSYHVISHTDTEGFNQIVNELKRVIKPDGQIFLTLCSKETWSFAEANFPKLDENTVLKDEPPAEINVPHFFVNRDDILNLFKDFEITQIRHIDNCYVNGKKQNNKHYFVEMNCHKEAKKLDYSNIIGTIVKGHIDRPIGSNHPRAPNIHYDINYGYIDGVFAADHSEQDIYLLGEDKPVETFTARVVAVWHRHNDVEDKWIVVPENCTREFSDKEIMDAIIFQEQFFDGKLYR